MADGRERRRTIRIKRSQLLQCKLGEMDRPAIKIVEGIDEYSKAFKLIYDEYFQSGYVGAHRSRMSYTIWSLLPTTNIFVFKSYLDVVSTIAHILDTDLFGLPIDAVFKDKMDELRRQGRRIAEIGALATQRSRRWSNVMMFLYRAAFHYARHAKVDDLVLMVNPKHVRFYSQVLMIEPFGEERFYDKIGAPAVALRTEVGSFMKNLEDAYASNEFETDLHGFFNEFGDPLLQGEEDRNRRRRQLDPYSAYFFFRQRPELLQNLSDLQRGYLAGIYRLGLLQEASFSAAKEDISRSMAPVLEQLRLERPDEYTDIAFARNLGLIDYAGQRKLLRARVAIPGLGGVGGAHLMTLARTGVGAFTIADFDRFSPVNVNRQYGSDLAGFGRPKLEVMTERVLGVNPFLDLRAFPEGVTRENMDDFLAGADVLVDSLDFFAQGIRRALFNRALEKGIPVVTAAPAGYSASLLVFLPGGMNYDRYFGVHDDTDPLERLIRFTFGVAPRPTHLRYTDRHFIDLKEGRVPSLDIGCELCAGVAASQVVRLILGQKPVAAVPSSCQFDARRGLWRKTRLFMGMNSPWQRLKVAAAKRLLLPPPARGARMPQAPAPVPAGESIPEEALEYIVRAGIQAPSGDNVQPWRFRLGPGRIGLRPDRAADPSFFNVRQTATLLSCGAAVQNMEYAAGELGLDCRVEIQPAGEEDLAVSLHLRADGRPYHELMSAALWRRSTNRRLYSRAPVPEEVWERLAGMADAEGAALLVHTARPEDLRTLGQAVYMADRVRVERQDLHEYLMRTLIFDPYPADPDAPLPENFRRGMPLKNLQAGPAGELYLKAVRSWSAMRQANALGLGRAMPLYSRLSMHFCGGAGLLCAADVSGAGLIRAGKALQRVWCGLEHFGFAVQPMAALTLLNLRLDWEGEGAFSPGHCRLLREARDMAAGVLPRSEDYFPLLLFRTGKAGRIRHRTYRCEAADLLEG